MVLEGVHDANLNSMNGSPFPPFKDVRPNPVESKASTLLAQFITSQRELQKYRYAVHQQYAEAQSNC